MAERNSDALIDFHKFPVGHTGFAALDMCLQVLCNPLEYRVRNARLSLVQRQVCAILKLEPTMLIFGTTLLEPEHPKVDVSAGLTSHSRRMI